jgi:hypothetical protein
VVRLRKAFRYADRHPGASDYEAAIILELVKAVQRPNVPNESLEGVTSADSPAVADRVSVVQGYFPEGMLKQPPSVSPLGANETVANDRPGVRRLHVALVDDDVALSCIPRGCARECPNQADVG